MKKVLLLLFLLFCIVYCFKSCGSDDNKYDEEYWRSVAREKQMRKAGLKEFADMEKSERQVRLRNMEATPPKKERVKITPTEKNESKPIFGIKFKEKIFLLDKPNGNKILNKKATDYFGKNTYYQIGELDNVIILEENDGWAKIQHAQYSFNQGWIKKEYLIKREKSNTERTRRGLHDYKGSKGQKDDLKAIDEYMKMHPNF